jgi:hypothetical protein
VKSESSTSYAIYFQFHLVNSFPLPRHFPLNAVPDARLHLSLQSLGDSCLIRKRSSSLIPLLPLSSPHPFPRSSRITKVKEVRISTLQRWLRARRRRRRRPRRPSRPRRPRRP